jgi:hypothetical protein
VKVELHLSHDHTRFDENLSDVYRLIRSVHCLEEESNFTPTSVRTPVTEPGVSHLTEMKYLKVN